MYGLPGNIDLRFLVGKVLQQVAIGERQIQFNFDALVSISIESAFDITRSGQRSHFTAAPESATVACALLGEAIAEETHDVSGRLVLLFHSGSTLEIADFTDRYESYQINNGLNLIVV